jgi:hypothetical protein
LVLNNTSGVNKIVNNISGYIYDGWALATTKAIWLYIDSRISNLSLSTENHSNIAPSQEAVKNYVQSKIIK